MVLTKIAIWSLVIGGVFLLSGLARGPIRRWPVSMPLVYLLVGIAIGPWGLGLLDLHLVDDAKTLEVLAEIAVLVSLLTAGLRLTPSWRMYLRAPIPLASLGMVATVVGIALLGHFAIGLSLGAAVLLGAVLAPTDPVLASEVQVHHEQDRNKLRYSLTGEAGLNDGAAFPFVMLGLGLLGLHDLGGGWRWLAVDLVWACAAGIASGWIMGYLVSRLAIWVKRSSDAPAACEELLTLGLIGISYGIAMAISAYGFLAVFAAGVATRIYADQDDDDDHPDETLLTVAEINEQFERILEVAMVVIIGVLLSNTFSISEYWYVPLVIFFIIRPLAATLSLWLSDLDRMQRTLIALFGIRGIGSIYYLAYAFGYGVEDSTAETLAGIVLTTIAASLLIHSNLAALILDRYASSSASDDGS